MRATRITRLAATVIIAAASLTAAAATVAVPAQASFVGTDEGYGSTLQAAEANALAFLRGDYSGCKPPVIYYDYGQNPDGTWYAWAEENCTGYR